MDTGTVIFRTSIILGNSRVQLEIIEHLLFANWCFADTFFPAFILATFDSKTPEEAIDLAINKDSNHENTKEPQNHDTLKTINRIKRLLDDSLN